MKKIYKMALDMIFPRHCPICDDIIIQDAGAEKFICTECYDKITFTKDLYCMKCGRRLIDSSKMVCSNCKDTDFSFNYGYVLLDYDDDISTSLSGVKYKGKREYLDFYGRECVYRLASAIRETAVSGLVPVPIHSRRRNQRGYNQTEILCELIASEMGLVVYDDIIERRENTKALKELGREDRKRMLEEAIVATREVSDIDRVLLVDDIMTTGSTLEACTNALIGAGIKEVYTLVIAAKPDA